MVTAGSPKDRATRQKIDAKSQFRSRLLHSESFRLATIYAAIFVISFLLFSALVYFTVDAAFRSEALHTADSNIATIANAYSTEGIPEAQEVIGQSLAEPSASDFLLLQQNGKRLAGNMPVMAATTGIVAITVKGRSVLGRGTFLTPGLYVFAGRDLTTKDGTEASILQTLAWVFAGALIVAACGGVLLSRSFLTRMDDITRTCRAIMEGRFADRIPIRGSSDELDRLAVVINQMLDRIAALMDNLKQVSSDIAHDLRTPLTRLRSHLERTGGQARTETDYVQALNGALSETDEILALFSALLRIAQIESGSRRAGFSQIDLAALVQHVAEIYRPVTEDAGYPFTVAAAPSAPIQGDRELLIQLLANLIENAIRHTPAGTAIALGLKTENGNPVLFVADAGPGIPVDQREAVFRRFTRLERSRTAQGNGLGLALVAAITELHGGTVTILDHAPGTRIPGTRVEVRFGAA
jgi:signal transduction histidine kinase